MIVHSADATEEEPVAELLRFTAEHLGNVHADLARHHRLFGDALENRLLYGDAALTALSGRL